MESPWRSADVVRALDLIATPLALEVLDGLGHGRTPNEIAPPDTAPATIDAAVEQLRQIDAVSIALDGHGGRSITLTDRGRRIHAAFEQIGGPEQA